MRWLLFLLVAVLVNLPYAHEGWTDHQVATKGRDVEAIVLDARSINGRYLIDYRLPRSIDPAGTKFSAAIDQDTYRHAVSSDRLAVRAVPGRPGANRPAGLVPSSLFQVVALTGDAVLVLIAALLWYRRRHPGDMPDPHPRPVGL